MKSMKIMKIDEIAASQDRAKVSIGATGRSLGSPQPADTPTLEIHEIS